MASAPFSIKLGSIVHNEEALKQKALQAPMEKPFNPYSEVERNKAQEISITTGTPVDQVEAEREEGLQEAEAQAKAYGLNTDYAEDINKAYNEGLSAQEVANIIVEKTEKGKDMAISQYLLLQNLMLGDNDINPYASRTLTNMNIWNDLLTKELEENDQSGVSKVLSFLDVNVLRELTIGAFENVTFRSNREGTDIREAFNNLSPQEFQEWAAEYIEERKDEGIFTEDSLWNLYKAANDATYLGDDPLAGVNFLFGAADIVSLGTTKLVTAGAKTTVATASEIASKAGSITKIRKPVDAVAVLGDEVQAANALNKMVDDVGAQTDQVNAGRGLTEDLDPVKSPIERPSQVPVRNHAQKNRIVEELEEVNRRGTFGEYLPRQVIEEVATQTAERVARRTNDVVLNTRTVIAEGSDDYKVIVRMGKDGTGAPFRRKMDAEAIAKNDPSLKVVKKEQGRGWFVEAEQRLDLVNKSPQLEILEKGSFLGDAMNKMVGAATVRLGDKLGAKFMQAETGQALVGDIVRPYEKTIRKVKGKELENLSDFFTQLRDGDLSSYRQAPTRSGFRSLYKTHYGKFPEKATEDAYEAVLEISDASWHIQSSARLKRIVAAGGEFADFGNGFGGIVFRTPASQVDDQVLDLVAQRPIQPNKLKEDAIVYKLADPYLDHIYVTNPVSTRVLERVDVMPYNVGGPRTNAEFRWFVGTIKEQALASGKRVSTGFKTMLGSFGKDQATTAQRQLNNISDKVDNLMKNAGVDDIQSLALSKADYDELGDVIRANNDWNKHVTDLEDLQRLGRDYNFNFNERFVFKARDEKVDAQMAGTNPSRVGTSVGEDVGTSLNSQRMKRRDTPLMEYGGKKAVNANPITAMADQFGSEVFGYANRAASKNAIEGWNKLADYNPSLIRNWDQIKGLDPMQRFLQAEVTKSGKFNDLAAQMREQQDIIKRRLNQPSWLSDKWETFTTSATEAIFEKTGFKVDLTKTDPASRLLQVGFYSKFGFFNPDQLMLQGLHSLTIVGISPVHGAKGMGLAAPLMMLMNPLMTKQARSLALERLTKAGINTDEIKDIIRYIDESGRNIVDNQVIELQAPQKFGASSTLKGKAAEGVGKFLDASTLFFKEGDRFTRLTGIVTAFLEHRAKRPDIDPFSPEGKTWITNREQDLTFRMTTSSRNYVQSGIMRVPTQWLSFSLRAMENIAVGRNFTVGERARMFAVMGPMFGLTGLGAGRMAGYFTEKLGYDANDPNAVGVFNFIKYGLFDELLSYGLGTETAYATRVAPADQLIDTWRKLFEESFVTTLFGPSGEIANDMKSVAVSAIRSMVSGRTEMVREDLTQLVRNLSTVDKYIKIRELIETGNYRSRTRKDVVGGMTPNDAAAVLMGATPAPVQNYYDLSEMVYKKGTKYRDMQKELRGKATLAYNLLTGGDKDDIIRGAKLWEEITDQIWASNLSDRLKVSLQNSLVDTSTIFDILKNAHRQDLSYDAGVMSQQIQ
jgi:hypothetical protein